MLWSLVGLVQQQIGQVQIFHDQARLTFSEPRANICGQSSRYLDSWLMSPVLCRESFAAAAASSDLSIVHGAYDCSRPEAAAGGVLDPICEWLDLPRLAVIDVAQLEPCRLPPRPEGISGLLLDRVGSLGAGYWQTLFEAMWRVPVLATLPDLPSLRARIAREWQCERASCCLCAELGRHLAESLDVKRLIELAGRHLFPALSPRIFLPGDKLSGLKVAVAFDQAFYGYFPEVLELMEQQGAEICTFSPLRDETLPADTDVVYIGCGQPDRYAAELSRNDCMSLALRSHARRGGRVYAEGGGMAYVARELRATDGNRWPMVGLLPAVVARNETVAAPAPSEAVLKRDHWLGPIGSSLRGYLDPRWSVYADPDLELLSFPEGNRSTLIGHRNVVGSLAHIDFAALPDFLECFRSSAAASIHVSGA